NVCYGNGTAFHFFLTEGGGYGKVLIAVIHQDVILSTSFGSNQNNMPVMVEIGCGSLYRLGIAIPKINTGVETSFSVVQPYFIFRSPIGNDQVCITVLIDVNNFNMP